MVENDYEDYNDQLIYNRQYYIDPKIFYGRPDSWYFIGTLKYRRDNYLIFDDVDMIVVQDNKEIITCLGNDKKFEIDKYIVTY